MTHPFPILNYMNDVSRTYLAFCGICAFMMHNYPRVCLREANVGCRYSFDNVVSDILFNLKIIQTLSKKCIFRERYFNVRQDLIETFESLRSFSMKSNLCFGLTSVVDTENWSITTNLQRERISQDKMAKLESDPYFGPKKYIFYRESVGSNKRSNISFFSKFNLGILDSIKMWGTKEAYEGNNFCDESGVQTRRSFSINLMPFTEDLSVIAFLRRIVTRIEEREEAIEQAIKLHKIKNK